MELIIVLAISCCLTDHQNLSDCKQARIIAHGVGWGFGGSGATGSVRVEMLPTLSVIGESGGRILFQDGKHKLLARDWTLHLIDTPSPPIRLLECPHDTAADFSHIQTSKAKTGGDAASLPIQAMGFIYLPLLGYWLDTLLFSVGEVSASPWTLWGVNVEAYSRGWVRSEPLNNS